MNGDETVPEPPPTRTSTPAAPSPAAPAVSPPTPSPVPSPGGPLPPAPAGSWDLDLAAASLRLDTDDVEQLFQSLGDKLERILGSRARVARGGGLLRRQRVDRITVDTADGRLEAVRGRSGPEFLVVHAVRGITLRTSRIEAGEWLQQLVHLVGEESARSAEVRAALGGMLE